MRKYDSLMHLKELGLNVGELREFEYSQRDELYQYARYLFAKFGGLIVMTDFPKSVQDKKPVGLPYMTDCKDFRQFEGFVEMHKDKYNYILLQMIGNEKTILSAYVYLDEFRNLRGEINDVDKFDMRKSMTISEHLKEVCVGPGGRRDERLERVRTDLLRAKIEPHRIVELAVFSINGIPTPFYKQLRGKGF